jgi:hypothetical protein
VGIGMERTSLKIEVCQLNEMLKRISKEQAIVFIQSVLRQVEESLNEPDAPALKIRMEKILEELRRSQ